MRAKTISITSAILLGGVMFQLALVNLVSRTSGPRIPADTLKPMTNTSTRRRRTIDRAFGISMGSSCPTRCWRKSIALTRSGCFTDYPLSEVGSEPTSTYRRLALQANPGPQFLHDPAGEGFRTA